MCWVLLPVIFYRPVDNNKKASIFQGEDLNKVIFILEVEFSIILETNILIYNIMGLEYNSWYV